MNNELMNLKNNIVDQLDIEEANITDIIEKNKISVFSISYKGSIVTVRFNSIDQNLIVFITGKEDSYIIKESLKNIVSLSVGANPDIISEDGNTISWWKPFCIDNSKYTRKQKKSQIY